MPINPGPMRNDSKIPTLITAGIVIFTLLVLVVVLSLSSHSASEQDTVIINKSENKEMWDALDGTSNKEFEPFYITVNLCETDLDNADIWQNTPINLFESPDSSTIITKVPACSNARLKVVGTKTYNGVEMYQVDYNSITGWQTKRLLTGDQ